MAEKRLRYQNVYDPLEKLTQKVDPLQQLTVYEYNSSQLHKMTLPNGSIREIFYDECSRPIAIR